MLFQKDLKVEQALFKKKGTRGCGKKTKEGN